MPQFAFAVILLFAIAIPASSAPAQSSSPVQAVSDHYDFGARSELDMSPISHTFILNAVGTTLVTVDRLQPSCHCTHAVADRETDSYGRFTIPAGQSVDIAATVDQADLAPGDVEKDIYVFINGESTPAVTLHLMGRITPAVSFAPTTLDFGKIASGATPVKTIAITIDQRLLRSGKFAALRCANPAIIITKSGSPVAVADGYSRQTYQIAVSAKMVPGIFKTSLALKIPDAAEQSNPFWSIPVTGIVAPLADVNTKNR